MTNTQFPRSAEEVASQVAHNITSELRRQGHDLTWLSEQMPEVSPHGLLKAMSESMPFAFILDIADILGVPWDQLADVNR